VAKNHDLTNFKLAKLTGIHQDISNILLLIKKSKTLTLTTAYCRHPLVTVCPIAVRRSTEPARGGGQQDGLPLQGFRSGVDWLAGAGPAGGGGDSYL